MCVVLLHCQSASIDNITGSLIKTSMASKKDRKRKAEATPLSPSVSTGIVSGGSSVGVLTLKGSKINVGNRSHKDRHDVHIHGGYHTKIRHGDKVKNVTGSHNYVGNKAKGQAQMNFGNTQDSHDANISGSYNAEKNRRKHAQPEDTGGEALPEWGQQPEESDTLEVQVDLPEKWPDAEIHDPHSVSVAFVEDGTEMETLFNSTVEHKLSSVYPMHQKIRGVFLLINNETFNEPEASSRHGTELDAEALEQLFDQLGFSVESHTDCTAKEMQDLLESQFKKRDHKQYDSFACAILSHGSRGVVKGVDGNELSLDTITDIVTRSNCRSLVGKPKLFFIQACQGDYTDRGIEREDGDVDEEPGQEDIIYLDSEVFSDHSRAKAEAPDATRPKATTSKLKTTGNSTICESDGPLVTSGADIFIVNATISGFRALRNERTGTWFIQAIVYIFSKFASMFDIYRLMILVKQLVSRAEGRVYINKKTRQTQVAKQQPSVGPDSLNKQLYFFPGLTRHQRR
ncbi:hypothetical protein BaRGS_00040273 [Batillaria attramentaria]|uniref:Uncharacterized protein n=1 Tax=Batillaria attramentaria TaxID=370345 RepID=A0ABD0J0P5_9CAEN